MPLKSILIDFRAAIAGATVAPDRYACPELENWEENKKELKELWAEIRPKLKCNLDRTEWIDAKLQEMFDAFAAGHDQKGRDIAWDLYGFGVEKLR